jgi:hypothetical protein
MKRAAEYTGLDDNGAPLKKHDDDDIDVRIARIRDEMVVTQQTISSLHADLDKQQQRYARLERELRDAYNEKERALQKEREDFELSTQRINTTVTSSRIKLDVGGRIFSVTLDMMLKYPDSFFARLFSGRWEDKKTEDGVYFINHSGDHFHHIVNFLRDGGLDVSLSEDDHRALCREADFYQLKELLDVLNPSVDDNWTLTETPNGVLSNDGLTLTGKKKNKFASSRGTIGWTHGVHEWVVRIDGESYSVDVGISPENINHVGHNEGITCVLGCYSGNVCAFGNNGVEYMDVPDDGLPDGSLISARLDLDKRTLTFGLNGKWHDKPAMTDIAPNMWYPYVELWNSGYAITIIR